MEERALCSVTVRPCAGLCHLTCASPSSPPASAEEAKDGQAERRARAPAGQCGRPKPWHCWDSCPPSGLSQSQTPGGTSCPETLSSRLEPGTPGQECPLPASGEAHPSWHCPPVSPAPAAGSIGIWPTRGLSSRTPLTTVLLGANPCGHAQPDRPPLSPGW